MINDPLKPFREQINQIDEQILTLLAKRRDVACEIGKIKINANRAIKDLSREQKLLETLSEKARVYGISPELIHQIYSHILHDSVALQDALQTHLSQTANQRDITIAFLGPKGSYSHLAAHDYLHHYLDSVNEAECKSFADIIKQVEDGRANYGILPIENTSSGSINDVYDLLQNTTLSIIAELTLPIEHALLACDGASLDTIETVYSHPQPIQQCSQYLARHPNWKHVFCDSTSSAMQEVAKLNAIHAAAIGHKQSGEFYHLHALDDVSLANQEHNMTRFIIVASKPIDVPETIPAKTTLLLTTKQHAGALVDALLVFRKHHIIMSKLESRPIHGSPWQEMFYIDVQENLNSSAMQAALRDLPLITPYFKVLGCYPSEMSKPAR